MGREIICSQALKILSRRVYVINLRLGKLEIHIKISKLSTKEMGLEFKMPKMGKGKKNWNEKQ